MDLELGLNIEEADWETSLEGSKEEVGNSLEIPKDVNLHMTLQLGRKPRMRNARAATGKRFRGKSMRTCFKYLWNI
jgi:hypothetical protein